MKRIAIWLMFLLITASALAAPPQLDDEAQAVVAKRNETREARMQWWRDAKFGMFIHWNVSSVPGGIYKGEKVAGIGEWIMNKGQIPVAEYRAFAKQFNPTKFNANEWVKVMKDAGMKYVVITAKHHDGFAMFHSDHSTWDIDDASPFKRDPIAELAKACRENGIKFGTYYSHHWDWVHPGGGIGKHNQGWDPAQEGDNKAYWKNIAIPQIREILTRFKPDVMWFDTPFGWGDHNEVVKALALQPNVVVNGRLVYKNGATEYGEDYMVHERSVPNHAMPMDWETCGTMNGTWGYKSYDTNWGKPETFIQRLIRCAGGNGNFLLNVGPDPEGIIPEGSVKVLKQVGDWLQVNGETIYGTRGGPFDPISLTWGACTAKGSKLYLHVMSAPGNGKIELPGLSNKITKAYLFKDPSRTFPSTREYETAYLDISGVELDPIDTIFVVEVEGKPQAVTVPIRADHQGVICLLPHKAHCEAAGVGSHSVKNKGFPAAVLARCGATPDTKSVRVDTVHIGKGPRTKITWDHLLVEKPGKYRVALKYWAADKKGVSPYRVTIDGQTLTGKTALQSTMDNSGVLQDLGTVDLKDKKQIVVIIQPGEIDPSQHRQHMIWLYALLLTPVD